MNISQSQKSIQKVGTAKLSRWSGILIVTDPTWGDNGKGKVVDLLSHRADMVIRFAGGPNAGHTVQNSRGQFKFHVVPSGICNPKTLCVLAEGVVVNPLLLAQEIEAIRKQGITVSAKNLAISTHAHLIMPWHRMRDGLTEAARGNNKVGTTGHGIGPAYADKTGRIGLRVGDLLHSNFQSLFNSERQVQERMIYALQTEKQSQPLFKPDELLEQFMAAQKILAPFITDTLPLIWRYVDSKKRIIGEGAQGMLLDIDLGSYPYVTSSHPGLSGFSIATGIDPRCVTGVIGVTKAYATRVGGGPMPTELRNETGDKLRSSGNEFGTTTGRPRRCGWLDIPAIRYGARIGTITCLALTKLDILDSFEKINLCVAYRYKGKTYQTLPTADPVFMSAAKPIYETLPGWQQPTSPVRSFEKLPKQAKAYVKRIEKLAGLPIAIVSVGARREATMFL